MTIFSKFKIGDLELSNRVVMAPMTRCRAIDNIPNDLMVKYYSDRASAGLIITEGTSPSTNGLGYARIPGAFSVDQISGWAKIANQVHEKGGAIFAQLMHTGRASPYLNMPEGGKILAPSAIPSTTEIWADSEGNVLPPTPIEMTIEQVNQTIDEYVDSAIKLINGANLDGVELHGANGYLIDQFLNPKSNNRFDEFGGDGKRRAQFLLEIVLRLSKKVDVKKIGVRLSPGGVFNDMDPSFPGMHEMYLYIAEELEKIGVGYIHLVDHSAMGAPAPPYDLFKSIRGVFKGPMIVGGGLQTTQHADLLFEKGYDLVYFGRPFISNPDLVDKLREGASLAEPDPETFYTPNNEGYNTYK